MTHRSLATAQQKAAERARRLRVNGCGLDYAAQGASSPPSAVSA
jgi:hypothetical protein